VHIITNGGANSGALHRLKNDLPTFNGDPSWTLPMPGRFVIAPDGTIVYAEVNPDYTRRPDPEAMLPALKKIALAAA
jgi:peroxiredoxin